jgi:hypothetical protein
MNFFKRYKFILAAVMLPLLTSCQTAPQNVNVELPKTLPVAKVTVFNDAIHKLGTMGAIYNGFPVRVMVNEIVDNTGTSVATQAEIPRDITAMVKSTLNGMGGNVLFIPYDANFMANAMNTGYTKFDNKVIPDIIVDGGITEFDRGLTTKGDSTELDATGTFNSGKKFGFNFEDSNKASTARVTLDFNLIDFQTFSGIPQMQAISSMMLNKAVKKDAIGLTIMNVNFGAKGEVKKIQGRHAAIRMLVQLSMIQVIGKYQNLPYWTLLPGAKQDVPLMNRVIDDFYALPQGLRIARLQTFMALNGLPVNVTGVMDQATIDAKQTIISKHGLSADASDAKVFATAYVNVPITRENKFRSVKLHQKFDQLASTGVISPDTGSTTSVATLSKPKPKPPVIKAADDFSGNINLWTDQKNYQLGDEMTVSFTVDKPMYVRVAVISSDGGVSTLFPNVFQNDNFAKPGVTYQIPPKGSDDFSLDIGKPIGTDKIRALGTAAPVVSSQVVYNPDGKLDTNKLRVKVVESATDITIQ